MPDCLTVNLCVGIRKECPVSYLLNADNQAEFSFGGPRAGYDFAFDRGALQAFLMLGAQALTELDARTAQEKTGAVGAFNPTTSGDQSS